jgi:Flp pilus assembly protein TadG
MLGRFRRSESGAELIEFALTLPLLLLVVLGIIEFGFVFQQYEVVTNAAREGARIASLSSTYGATAATRISNAKARVNDYLTAGGLSTSAATICVGPANNDALCDGSVSQTVLPGGGPCVWTVRVKVEYAHPVAFVGGIISYFGGTFGNSGNLTLRARSTMRTEAAVGACPP